MMKTLIKIIIVSSKKHKGFHSCFSSAPEQKMRTLTLSPKAHRSGIKASPQLMLFPQGFTWLLAGLEGAEPILLSSWIT